VGLFVSNSPSLRSSQASLSDIRTNWRSYWNRFELEELSFTDAVTSSIHDDRVIGTLERYGYVTTLKTHRISQDESCIQAIRTAVLICRLTRGMEFISTLLKRFTTPELVAALIRCADDKAGYLLYSSQHPESYAAGVVVQLFQEPVRRNPKVDHQLASTLDSLRLDENEDAVVRNIVRNVLKVPTVRRTAH
jgi:hypothetical protein